MKILASLICVLGGCISFLQAGPPVDQAFTTSTWERYGLSHPHDPGKLHSSVGGRRMKSRSTGGHGVGGVTFDLVTCTNHENINNNILRLDFFIDAIFLEAGLHAAQYPYRGVMSTFLTKLGKPHLGGMLPTSNPNAKLSFDLSIIRDIALSAGVDYFPGADEDAKIRVILSESTVDGFSLDLTRSVNVATEFGLTQSQASQAVVVTPSGNDQKVEVAINLFPRSVPIVQPNMLAGSYREWFSKVNLVIEMETKKSIVTTVDYNGNWHVRSSLSHYPNMYTDYRYRYLPLPGYISDATYSMITCVSRDLGNGGTTIAFKQALDTYHPAWIESSLSPNPTDDAFVITGSWQGEEDLMYQVFDMTGKQMYQASIARQSELTNGQTFHEKIQTTSWPSGIYHVVLQSGKEQPQYMKLIRQ